ncbi:MAG TPA: CocE/NonD family hydrolase [Syntrophales bacterium]|nr:CocE/NonD family hydrolase [Syntrophales bacterium]
MDAIIGTGNLSKRQYGIIRELDIPVIMSDGVNVVVDIFRPDNGDKFPALLSMSPYNKDVQSDRLWPRGMMRSRVRGVIDGCIEAGPTDFFVRRGYVHIIGSVRGTGKSGGAYRFMDHREVRDLYEIVEWAAQQPWCNGNVGMLGVSYFAWNQQPTAVLRPPHLKAIFPLFGATDQYRDLWWHGGILCARFVKLLLNVGCLDINNQEIAIREELGEKGFKQAISGALADRDISADPELVAALTSPDGPGNAAKVDVILHPTDGPYWRERSVADWNAINIPAYVGACWGNYSIHLPGAFHSWANLKVPKKMVIGPPIYVDRPFYQYQWEILRWYDYWLKSIDTGIMDEPPVKIWVMGTNDWKMAEDWPIPGTRWIPFNLHPGGILSEMEPWSDAPSASFDHFPSEHGSMKYYSPPLVENTEVVGPMALYLHSSCRGTDVNFFVSLWDVDPNGNESLLTRGWLKGSYREIDQTLSKPWQPVHSYTNPKSLIPGEVYQFAIEIVPNGNLFKAGHRICLKISCADDEEPQNSLEICFKHLLSQTPNTVTIYHDADHPSYLLLPITRGNIVGTYMSGGDISTKTGSFVSLKPIVPPA